MKREPCFFMEPLDGHTNAVISTAVSENQISASPCHRRTREGDLLNLWEAPIGDIRKLRSTRDETCARFRVWMEWPDDEYICRYKLLDAVRNKKKRRARQVGILVASIKAREK